MGSRSDQFDLTAKVALVTGAARGLGLVMATALAEVGARLVIADINRSGAQSAAAGLRAAGHEAMALRVDVSDGADVERMVEETLRACDRIDILINNAGINRGGEYPPENLGLDIWDSVLAINLTGSFLCAQAVGREMIRQGGGKIINITSISGLVVNRLTDRHPLPYCVSKAGVVMLTKVLAVEWARHKITVNAIAPGYFRTAMLNPDPKIQAEMVRDTPIGRLGEPAELAGTVVYLASEASSCVTGHVLLVDGGYTVW
jgi:NAD(P)-dependent dehydrogenase (short-subunit alcohol dehydrogenase family)